MNGTEAVLQEKQQRFFEGTIIEDAGVDRILQIALVLQTKEIRGEWIIRSLTVPAKIFIHPTSMSRAEPGLLPEKFAEAVTQTHGGLDCLKALIEL